ncbi:hypothetical protein SEA_NOTHINGSPECIAL_81 [Mycobacterium phage NothingSpecial]|nr:hypothetical protein SEA_NOTHINGSPECIAL_81 [Mycobacterium phage NothingSpecial]
MKKRTKKKLKRHGMTVAVAFVTTVTTLALGSPAKASADTVNLTEIPVEDYPVCQVEDCSDVPNQEGLWEDKDTGNWYFEQGERTWLVVDDTVR